LVTVAIALLLLVHVPPVVGLRVAVLPTHTAAGAVTVGSVTQESETQVALLLPKHPPTPTGVTVITTLVLNANPDTVKVFVVTVPPLIRPPPFIV
jgi:hypothetical protein